MRKAWSTGVLKVMEERLCWCGSGSCLMNLTLEGEIIGKEFLRMLASWFVVYNLKPTPLLKH